MYAELRVLIGSRLRDERVRLDLNQGQLADAGQVSRRSIVEWERGGLVPTAEFLARVAPLGVDTLYVVTGQRIGQRQAQVMGVLLSSDELELMDAYRACNVEDRAVVRRIAGAVSAR